MEIGIIINNFSFVAYNNDVEEITITQNGSNGLYMSYLYGKVRDRFSFLPAMCEIEQEEDGAKIAFKTERAYCSYVRKFTEEHIAEVISIGYKYAYFDKRLPLPFLTKMQRRTLLSALVAADYQDDRAYVLRRVKGFENYCIDGLFHFRLQQLKKRWEEIIEYIPTNMSEVGIESFICFLVEDGKGKVFLKNGKLYDEDYRQLSRSILTGAEWTIGEILLSSAEQVYCFGETEEEVKSFLKKYYGEKAFFC